jgi:hypothetical protein
LLLHSQLVRCSWEVQLVLEYCDQGSLRQLLNKTGPFKTPGTPAYTQVLRIHLFARNMRFMHTDRGTDTAQSSTQIVQSNAWRFPCFVELLDSVVTIGSSSSTSGMVIPRWVRPLLLPFHVPHPAAEYVPLLAPNALLLLLLRRWWA